MFCLSFVGVVGGVINVTFRFLTVVFRLRKGIVASSLSVCLRFLSAVKPKFEAFVMVVKADMVD